MAVIKNPDGSITVGIIPEEQEEKEPTKEEKAEPKKTAKKSK